MRETNDEAVHTPDPEEGDGLHTGRRHTGSGRLTLYDDAYAKKKTEGRYPTICRDQSDLSKMPSFYTYGNVNQLIWWQLPTWLLLANIPRSRMRPAKWGTRAFSHRKMGYMWRRRQIRHVILLLG
jgi:hypothetical protein